MGTLGNLSRFVQHAAKRKFVEPRRDRQWRSRTKPFVHASDGDLKFNLYPGEYIDRYIYVEGSFDGRFLAYLATRFSPPAVALDIGGNIGNHSLRLRHSFSRIHAFEPNPVAADRLRANIALNRASNIHVEEVGLSDQDASLPFAANPDGNLGASRFVTDPAKATQTLQVRNGDEYVAALGIDRLDFIKCDVEGHELDVFRGLVGTVRRFKPVVTFEYFADREGYTLDRLAELLPGYVFYEPRFASEDAGAIGKLRWALKHGATPTLHRLEALEKRTYENVLAFANEAAVERFR